MQIEWVRFDRERYNPIAFAAVRQGAREGTLLDVATEQIFLGLLLRNLKDALTVDENGVQLEFRPTDRFQGQAGPRAGAHPDRRNRLGEQHLAGRQ